MIIIRLENLINYIPQLIFSAIVAYIAYKVFLRFKKRIDETNIALEKYQKYIMEKKSVYDDMHHLAIMAFGINPVAMGVDAQKFVDIITSKREEFPLLEKYESILRERNDISYIISHILLYMLISVWIGLMILLSPFNLAKIFLPEFSSYLNEFIIVLLASLIYLSILSLFYFLYGKGKDVVWNIQAAMSFLLLLAMFFPSVSFLWSGNTIKFATIFLSLLLLFSLIHFLILRVRKKSLLLTLSYFSILSSNIIFDIVLIFNIINFIVAHY